LQSGRPYGSCAVFQCARGYGSNVPDIRASSKVPDGLSPSVISETDLVDQLMERDPQQPVETTLRTDARVIARVTDGIYRQPGSALRELISNSYDADARRVTIHTDRPRFQRMVIEDDGIGMSPQALAHLLYHIGGSAKRTISGIELGITDSDDPNRSPGGRPLIGKIGIGLFSVAQLTQGFQVITKMAGDDKRTVASVLLRQYSEQIQDNSDAEYEAGKVLVWREPASDIEAHGTTIVLDAIRPQTRETLRSTDLWEAVYGTTETAEISHRISTT
jgi:HSP90 family molecular chaperone